MPVYAEKEQIDGQKRWYIRTYVTDENGKAKQITKHSKNWIGRDGKKEAEWEENRLKNNTYISQRKNKQKNITIHQLKEEYLKSLIDKLDNDSLKAKENRLNHFCEIDKSNQVKTYPNKSLISFDDKLYLEWQKQMKKKTYTQGKKEKNYSIEYLNRINNEICAMIDYGILENYCYINFAKKCGKIGSPKEVKISKKIKIYDVINYDQYLKLLDVSKNNLKYNTYFDLAFTRGPRIGEIRAFRICDYDQEKQQLMVNHTMSKDNILKEPKTASSKAPIDLDDTTNEKILKLIEHWKQFDSFNENWYIFNGETPISENAIRKAIEKYFKKAGINKSFRPHDFRHSCATWLFNIGVPIAVISKILRHANIKETLETYAHLFDTDYKQVLLELNSLRNNRKTRPKTRPKFIKNII